MLVPGLIRRRAPRVAFLAAVPVCILSACQFLPTDSAPGTDTRRAQVVLSADTLRLAAGGATGNLTARLFAVDGTEVIDQKANWSTSSSTSIALSAETCTFPCTVSLTSMAEGTVEAIARWDGPLGAIGDTAWVQVSSSFPAGPPIPPAPPTPPDAPPPPGVSLLVVLPASAVVSSGATRAFAAYDRTSVRDSAVAATWSATGGTISSTGLYTAGTTAGNYRVIATDGTRADTASVSVTVPPTLAQIVVVPASTTIDTSTTLAFSAYGKLTNNDSVSVTPAWTSTGGTITNSGVYTAGTTVGTFRVIGAVGPLADTAVITIHAPPPRVFLGPEVVGLPMTGAAWSHVLDRANAVWGQPDLCSQTNYVAIDVLAAALVYARTGTQSYKDKVVAAIVAAMPTQVDNCPSTGFSPVLALGVQLGGYVLAADYVGYRDPAFVSWLSALRTKVIGRHATWYSLRNTARVTSNNWGIHALASLVVADRYLGDNAMVAEDWAIFKGYGDGTWTWRANQDNIGTTNSYLSGWNCRPLGVVGRYRAIEDLSCGSPDRNGAPVEDASRSGSITVPSAGYVHEAHASYTVIAIHLDRAGYDAWGVNAQQVKRVADFRVRFGIFNDHHIAYWVAWVLNKKYGTNYPAIAGGVPRQMGYTDWLYAP